VKLVAIELADSGIVVVSDNGAVSSPSPGVALLDGPTIVIGQSAVEQERLQPRMIHDRFWESLGTEPLGRPFPDHLSTADLAHDHLAQIWKELERPDGLLLAVPGDLQPAKLGLLLGIAGSIGIAVKGLVDASVAAIAAERPASGRFLHVDIMLHRAIVTDVMVDDEVTRLGVDTDDRVGLRILRDAWARTLASRFVLTTRFDPLKLAETEQRLYDGITSVLDDLDEAEETSVSMVAGGSEYSVEISRRDVHAATEASCHRIAELVASTGGKKGVRVMLTHRAALLPGLGALLARQSGSEVSVLTSGAAARGALLQAGLQTGNAQKLPFVCRLPLSDSHGPESGGADDLPRTTDVVRNGPSPSHIVVGGKAYPISDDALVLGLATGAVSRGIDIVGETAGISRSHCTIVARDERAYVEDHSTYGTYLNGELIQGRAELIAGDHLRIGTPGVDLLAILVEE